MGMRNDVRFQDSQRIVRPAADEQRNFERFDPGGPNRSKPNRLTDSPGLVGELLESVTDPSLECTRDRHRVTVRRLELRVRQLRVRSSAGRRVRSAAAIIWCLNTGITPRRYARRCRGGLITRRS